MVQIGYWTRPVDTSSSNETRIAKRGRVATQALSEWQKEAFFCNSAASQRRERGESSRRLMEAKEVEMERELARRRRDCERRAKARDAARDGGGQRPTFGRIHSREGYDGALCWRAFRRPVDLSYVLEFSIVSESSFSIENEMRLSRYCRWGAPGGQAAQQRARSSWSWDTSRRPKMRGSPASSGISRLCVSFLTQSRIDAAASLGMIVSRSVE